jgi:hypothetical protein
MIHGKWNYSRSPAEPDSEGVLLPPTGMDVSTAIISARMSRTGCGWVLVESGYGCGWWLGAYLGDRLVVDVDELTGVGVDLERAVEAQRGLDVVCACNVESVGVL